MGNEAALVQSSSRCWSVPEARTLLTRPFVVAGVCMSLLHAHQASASCFQLPVCWIIPRADAVFEGTVESIEIQRKEIEVGVNGQGIEVDEAWVRRRLVRSLVRMDQAIEEAITVLGIPRELLAGRSRGLHLAGMCRSRRTLRRGISEPRGPNFTGVEMRPDKVTLLNGHSCATAIPKLEYDGVIQGLVLDGGEAAFRVG